MPQISGGKDVVVNLPFETSITHIAKQSSHAFCHCVHSTCTAFIATSIFLQLLKRGAAISSTYQFFEGGVPSTQNTWVESHHFISQYSE